MALKGHASALLVGIGAWKLAAAALKANVAALIGGVSAPALNADRAFDSLTRRSNVPYRSVVATCRSSTAANNLRGDQEHCIHRALGTPKSGSENYRAVAVKVPPILMY